MYIARYEEVATFLITMKRMSEVSPSAVMSWSMAVIKSMIIAAIKTTGGDFVEG